MSSKHFPGAARNAQENEYMGSQHLVENAEP